ncbi:MAG TPA: NfeD family protein [Ancylobacter sp.]
MESLSVFGGWGWFILAGLLLFGELMVPGAYLVWLGCAALATGLASPLLGIGWQGQVLLFAGLGLAAAIAGRLLLPPSRRSSDHPFLNRRVEELVGRSFVLADPIAGGQGRVRIDDTVWRVAGEDCPAGASVVVTGIDGTTLRVRPDGPTAA